MKVCLSVQSLVKDYQGNKNQPPFRAVNGISFEVHSGEILGVLGPNGAGKSTTIQCLTGFYPCTEGQVLIGPHDVHRSPKLARTLLGVCSQEDNLDTDFTLIQQLIRQATYFRVSTSEGRKRGLELLRRFDLLDKKDQLIETLSGGMRRRLQVARALVSEPKVLILDEPTTGLDPDARRSLWDVLIEQRSRGVGTLLSTHYMDEAERLCDRVLILHQGKVLDLDTPQALILKHMGTDLVRDEVRPGAVWVRPPNLEDVFMKLSGTRLEGATS